MLFVLMACKREPVSYLGPAYIAAPEGFAVTSFTGTPSPVNFQTTTVAFNATFTHTVTYSLTIVGQTSGAKLVRSGVANGITNELWKGEMDGPFFFRDGENAIATLSFFGTSLTSSVTINITKVQNYTTCGTYPRFGDFETPSKVEPQPIPPYYSAYWASFNYPTPIPNVTQGVDSVAVDYNGKPVPSVQGKKYYFIKGLGDQPVFVSGLQYFGSLIPYLNADPNRVWFNIYIYGTGDANASVDIEMQEDDIDGTTGGYQGDDDDAMVAHVTLNHKGWKLFSFRYNTLVPSSNLPFGGSGNHIHEPNRIRSWDIVLLKKSNPNSPVEVYFDYPLFTLDRPFKPCK